MLLVEKGVEWYWTFGWEPGPKGTVLSKNLRQNICGSHNKVIFRFKVSLQTYFWEGKERWWGIEEREGMREWIKIWPRTQAIDPRAVVLRQRNSKMIVQDPQNWTVSRLRATGLEPVRHFRKMGRRERKQTSGALLRSLSSSVFTMS